MISRSFVLRCALLAVVTGSTGCHRARAPSAEYTQARQLYGQLYGQKLDGAYSDPGMDEVLALLARVPADSLDAQGARDLIAQIHARRDALQAEAAEREKERARNNAPLLQGPVTFSPSIAPVYPDAGQAAAAVDSGVELPEPGMSAADFDRKFSRCFEPGGQAVDTDARTLDLFRPRDLSVCRTLYPMYVDQVILFRDGKLWASVNRSQIEQRTEQRPVADGGATNSQDAGAPSP